MKLIWSKEHRKKEKERERKQTEHTHILSLKLNFQKPHKGISGKWMTSGLKKNVSLKPSQLLCLLAITWPTISIMLWLFFTEKPSKLHKFSSPCWSERHQERGEGDEQDLAHCDVALFLVVMPTVSQHSLPFTCHCGTQCMWRKMLVTEPPCSHQESQE